MPIDRKHAFASGSGLSLNTLVKKSVFDPVWEWIGNKLDNYYKSKIIMEFQEKSTFDTTSYIGPNAVCINRNDPSHIRIGKYSGCRGILRVEYFGKGKINIGNYVYIGDDSILSSSVNITIGDHTLIAHGVQIFDNDSHPVNTDERINDYKNIVEGSKNHERNSISNAPISVGNSVWIGFNSTILKGVSIGDSCIIAANSVVTQNIPPGKLVAGNPAKIIKDLN